MNFFKAAVAIIVLAAATIGMVAASMPALSYVPGFNENLVRFQSVDGINATVLVEQGGSVINITLPAGNDMVPIEVIRTSMGDQPVFICRKDSSIVAVHYDNNELILSFSGSKGIQTVGFPVRSENNRININRCECPE